MKNTATSRKRPSVLATSISALLGLTILGLAPCAVAVDQYWDGPNSAFNGIIDGGTGTWSNSGLVTNWTNVNGTVNSSYVPANTSFFQGSAGTVTINAGEVISFSTLNFVTTGYVVNAVAGTVLAVNGATNINVTSPGTATINAQMVNAGSLTVGNGGVTGTLVLTNAANNFSGGVTLTGTATLLNNAATTTLGLGALTINGNGSTFGTGIVGAVTITNDVNINAGAGGNVNLTSGAGGLTLTNLNLQSTGKITSLGAGVKTITGTIAGGANGVTFESVGGGAFTYGATESATYTGTTTVQNGATLNLGSSNTNAAIIGDLTINSTGVVNLTVANQIKDTATVTVNTGANFILGGFNEAIKTLNGGGLNSVVQLKGGTLSVVNGDYSGNIADAGPPGGGIFKSGTPADVLKLSGDNNYSGNTTITGGTILAGSGTAFSQNSNYVLTIAGTTLDLGGFSNRIGSLNGGIGSVVQNSTATAAVLTTGFPNTSAVFTGNIINGAGGTLGVTKIGTGIQTFSGVNTYTGATTIQAGAINAGSTTGLSAGSAFIVQNTATLTLNGFSNTIASLSDGGTAGGIVQNGAVTNAILTFGDATNTTYKGTIVNGGGGTLGITKQGTGTTILGGLNTYTGTTTVNAGTLQAGIAGQAFGNGSAVTLNGSGALDLAGFTEAIGSLSSVSATALVKNSTNQAANLSTGSDNTNTTFAGVIQDGGLPGGLTSLTKVGTGTFKLAGANTYTGATTITGGTLQMGIANALSTGTDVGVGGGTVFDLNNFNQSIGSLAGGAVASVTLGTAVLTTGNDSLVNTTFSGVISGTAVTSGLTKVGLGIFTLDGAATNTYAGPTRVNDGVLVLNKTAGVNAIGTGVGGLFIGDNAGAPGTAILRLGAANQIDNITAVTIASDGRFDLNSQLETVGSVSSASAAAQITLGAGTLTTGDVNNTTYAGSINGITGSILKQGIGSWTLSGLNTYTGTTTVNAGALVAGSTTAFGTGSATTVALGATLDLNGFSNSIGSLAGAGTVKDSGPLPATLTILGNNGAAVTFSGKLIDDGILSLTKNGPGTEILSGSGVNTYSGATTVNGGILQAGALNAFSPNSATFVNTGGTLDLNGFNNTILSLTDSGVPGGTVTSTAAAILTFGDANSLTFHGNITGAGLGLVKQGTGTETLAGVNTYGGTTTVNAGKLLAGSGTAFGTASVVSLNNGATLDLGGFNNTIGSLAGLAGSIVQNSTGVPATLTTGLAANTTFAGNIINGAGAPLGLTKLGAGVMTLSGNDTYSGTTTINASALLAGSGTAFSALSATLVNTGGTLDLGGFNNTILSLSDNGAPGGKVQNSGNQNVVLTFGDANNLIFRGTIVTGPGFGTLGITKNGSGTETLSGANTYTGPTTINAGRLTGGVATVVGVSGAFGNGSAVNITAAGAALDLGGFNNTIGSLSGVAGSIVTDSVANATLTTGTLNQNATFAGNILDGPGAVLSFTKTGTGILTLSGINTYSGATTLTGGTLLAGSVTGLSAASAFTVGAGTTLDIGGFNNTILSLAGAATGKVQNSGAPNAVLSFGDITNQTFAGNIVVGPLGSGTLGITKNGTGTEILSGANTYTGPTNVNAGVLQAGSLTGLSATSAFSVNTGGTLDLGGFNSTILSLTDSGGAGGTVKNNGGPAVLTFGDVNSLTFHGNIINGTGTLGLIKQGTGTETVTGLNTYSGPTTITNGRLLAGSLTAFGVGSAVTVNLPGILDLGSFNNSIGNLSGNGTVKNTGVPKATLTITNPNGSNFSGKMLDDGPLGLTLNGPGLQILSGISTYSGDTNINGPGAELRAGSVTGLSPTSAFFVQSGGILSLGGPATAGFNNTILSLSDADGIGGVVQNGGTTAAVLTFGDATASLTFHGNIVNFGVGALGITKQGTGTEVLTGVNTYTGPTTVNAGRLLAGSATAFGTNSVVAVNTGGTLDLGGFSNTIGALTSNLPGGTVQNNAAAAATLTISGVAGLPATFAGNIINTVGAGALSLTKNGAGVQTLSGVNTYTGVTTINLGTLMGGSTTAFGTNSAVNITAAGATLDLGGFNNSIGSLGGVAGSIATTTNGPAVLTTGGNGIDATFLGNLVNGVPAPGIDILSLTKVGPAKQTLSGVNTYTGPTNINGGTLLAGSATGLSATSAFLVNTNGKLDINGFNSTILSLSDTGAPGGQVQNGGAANVVLTFGDANNLTFHGNIINGPGAGTLGLTKQGTGTETLTGISSYTGPTVVNAGRLLAGSATAFAPISAYTVNANSTLDIGGFNNTIGSLAGGGVFSFVQSSGGAATLTTGGNNTSTAYSGVIQNGPGGTLALHKVGSGTQTLSGPNSYSGITTFDSGGLHVDNNFALGTNTLIINNLAPGGTKLGSGVAGITFANAITVNADFAVDPTGILTASGPVTLNGTHIITGTTAGPANQFVFAGAIGQAAAGTGVTLDSAVASFFGFTGTAANTFTGLTTVQGTGTELDLNKTPAGTNAIGTGGVTVKNNTFLHLLNNEQIDDSATVTLLDTSTFNLDGHNETVHTLNSAVGTTIHLDASGPGGTLTVTNGLLDGLITDVGQAGSLVKNGGPADVLTITHANTYSGFTTLNGGVLNINNATALGTSTFQIKGNDDVVIGNTSGAPVTFVNATGIYKNFAVNGPDLLTANGVTTLRQLNTTINTIAGGLNFGTPGGAGFIGEFNPLSNLTFTGNTATTFAGTNSNTYTGDTWVLGGVLTLSKTFGAKAIPGDLQIESGATVKYAPGAAATDNQIATGSYAKVNGTLDLNGHSQEISGLYGNGDVRLGNGALTPGKLTVHFGVFLGNIQDAGPSGQLIKTTPGTLVLTGHNTLTGTTFVEEGSLILDGSVGGNVVVFGPGFLGGTGWVGGSLFNNGTVSPGHSPGTLTVNGNYTQYAAGLLKIEVGGLAANEHDLLAIHGTAFLNGTVEVIRNNSFSLKRHEKVIFLTADAGVVGRFSNELNQFHVGNALLDAEIIYDPFDVALELVQNSFLNVLKGLTPNQKAVAKALDGALNDRRLDKALDFLDNEPLGNIPHDLDLIAAEELQSIYTIGISQANVQSSNLERRMDEIRSGTNGFSASGYAVSGGVPQYSGNFTATPTEITGLTGPSGKGGKELRAPTQDANLGVFITGVGEFTHVGDTFNASGYDLATGGFTLGVDYKLGEHFAIGINAGYARTSADLFGNGRVSVDGAKLGVYATYFAGGFYADLSAQGGYNNYDTRRSALQGTARGSTNGGEFNALFNTGYDFKAGGLSVGPTASIQYTYVGFRGFTETGSLLPLAYEKQHGDSLRSSLGMKATYDWQIGGVVVRPELRAAWQHEFDNTEFAIVSRFANGAGNPFTVHGAETGRESLLLGAGVAVLWNERTSTYVYYDGEIGRTNYDSHNVSGGVRMSF